MATSSQVPPHALRLSSYGELEAYVRAFAAGHLHLLLLFGPPGVGKSRAVRQALDPRVGWISGQATPLGIYLQAFGPRGQRSPLSAAPNLAPPTRHHPIKCFQESKRWLHRAACRHTPLACRPTSSWNNTPAPLP